ncbi:hypothetical protein ACET3X_003373 [Alternaria dauci]|uniref:Proteophosphoglycan ppg4 n=1 Tax=Alternaria dauci TaxID=48095 RepID=A0ABR3US83_9PLEO
MAFLFFAAVFTLLGWLACEHDLFSFISSVPAAGPHTASSSPSSSASAPAGPVVSPSPSPSLPRRERRALARSQSRSPPPVPAWARPGSLLSPPRHRPVEDKYDTFLDVKSTEAEGRMERVWDPVNGWKWAAIRGGRLAARLTPLPNSPLPSPVIASHSPPAVVLPAPVSAPPAPAPTPIVVSPPLRSVTSILAGIPSQPQGLTHVFPLPAPAPLSQPQPLFGGLSLAAPAKYASSFLTLALPDPTPSVSMPLAPPPSPPLPTSLPAGADHKPQADDISGFVAPPPPSPSPFTFGGGFGVSAGTTHAPSSGGTFGAIFNFAAPSSFSSLSSPAPSASASGRPRDRRIIKRVYEPRFEDDRDDDDSLDKKYWDAGFTTLDSLMNADIRMVTGSGLENIADYISGSTLASFEHNLRQKENGLRRLANLLCWQCGSTRPQPPGGTVALGQLITVLARVDDLVRGFVADNGGQQQLFVQGDFFKWARAWRYLEKHWWQVRKTKMKQELDPAVYGRWVELVKRHQAHWVRFLREVPDEGKGHDW